MPTVLYSCVIDKKPLYCFQGLVFVLTLTKLARVDPRSIVIHAIEGTPQSAVDALCGLGAHMVVTPPFDPRHPYSNKLVQLESEPLRGCEYAVLCDCDLAFTAAISDWIGGDRLRAKPVDYPKPSLAAWQALFAKLGIAADLPEVHATHKPGLTYANNFNGGLYIIPQPVFSKLRDTWPAWNGRLLGDPQLLGDAAVHADQISLGVAMAELGYLGDPLPLELNLPSHLPVPEDVRFAQPPLVVHYHKEVNLSGRLRRTGHALVDGAIDRINAVIEASPAVAEVTSTLAFRRTILGQQTRRQLAGLVRPLTARIPTHYWSAVLNAVPRRKSV